MVTVCDIVAVVAWCSG